MNIQIFCLYNNKFNPYYICNVAARSEHLECLKYAHKNGSRFTEFICKDTAWHEHVECLKYVHENEMPITLRTCLYAAQDSHVECVKCAYKRSYILQYSHRSESSKSTARCGQLECFTIFMILIFHGMKKYVLVLHDTEN